MQLYPLVDLDEILKLCGIERSRLLEADAPRSRARETVVSHDLLHVGVQLVSQPVVEVQFRLALRREVGVVDEEGELHERLVVLLHCSLSGRRRLGRRRARVRGMGTVQVGGSGSRGRRGKATLQVLSLQPERQVLLAKVAPQKLAEQRS